MSFFTETFTSGDLGVYLAGGAILLFVVLLVFSIYLYFRIERLLGGTGTKSIEDSLIVARRDLDAVIKFKEESLNYLRSIEERVKRSAQAIETTRFNAFKGTGDGGNQSFSTAIINENGDGIIISSLYSRERVSIFSKPVKNFTPQFELSEEELETLSKAKESLALKKRI